ncbi:MAG: TetR/AcrR family transcriptional regulator [Opitutaceae bacterium]
MSKRRPPTARPLDREQSRRAIVAAAMRLFAERGLENVTFGQIAKAAKVSRPLVYFHFSDQRTLFLECVHVATVELQARFARRIDPQDTGLDQLETMGRVYFGLHDDAPALFQVLAMYESQPPADRAARELYERVEALHHEIDSLKTGLVRRGVKDGSIRRNVGEPQVVGTCLWGFCHGLAQLLAIKGPHLCACFGVERRKAIDNGFALLRHALAGKRG